jgi:hypothetical protein
MLSKYVLSSLSPYHHPLFKFISLVIFFFLDFLSLSPAYGKYECFSTPLISRLSKYLLHTVDGVSIRLIRRCGLIFDEFLFC